jgi:hypothetical protein
MVTLAEPVAALLHVLLPTAEILPARSKETAADWEKERRPDVTVTRREPRTASVLLQTSSVSDSHELASLPVEPKDA